VRQHWRDNCTTPTPNPSPQGGGEHTECAAPAAGFTLLELLIVLTILAVVAVFAVPQLAKPSDRLRLQAATRDLAAALRLTRASAISRNAEIALVVDVDARAFESPAVSRKSLPSDIDVQLKVAEPERPTRSRGGFRFYADGSSTGGDIVLRLRDNEARICVNWLTGKAEEGRTC
jgi:general secretion pathway protein H